MATLYCSFFFLQVPVTARIDVGQSDVSVKMQVESAQDIVIQDILAATLKHLRILLW